MRAAEMSAVRCSATFGRQCSGCTDESCRLEGLLQTVNCSREDIDVENW